MPDVKDAVKITSSVKSPSAAATQWGVPAIVGESTATDKDTPKRFVTLDSIETEHGGESDIYLGAVAMFAQGVREVYTVAIDADTAGTPTATEVETALGTLESYAASGTIAGAVLAAITASDLLEELQTFADSNKVVFVATHAADATVSGIVTLAAGLESENGMVVAFKSVGSDDVACAVLGAIMVHKPYHTLTWLKVNVDVDDYFSPTDVQSLETGRVNPVIYYKGENRLGNGLSLKSTVPYLDITRTRYYISGLLSEAVADGRLSAATIPYTKAGIEAVRGWLLSPLESLVKAGAISEYSIEMPDIENISDADKAARKLTGVLISVQIAGDIQTYELELTLNI